MEQELDALYSLVADETFSVTPDEDIGTEVLVTNQPDGHTASANRSDSDSSVDCACQEGHPLCPEHIRKRNRQHTRNYRKKKMNEMQDLRQQRDAEHIRNLELTAEIEEQRHTFEIIMKGYPARCVNCGTCLDDFSAAFLNGDHENANEEFQQRLRQCREFIADIKISAVDGQQLRPRKPCNDCEDRSCNNCNNSQRRNSLNHHRRKNALISRCRNELTWSVDELTKSKKRVDYLHGQVKRWIMRFPVCCPSCGCSLGNRDLEPVKSYSRPRQQYNNTNAPFFRKATYPDRTRSSSQTAYSSSAYPYYTSAPQYQQPQTSRDESDYFDINQIQQGTGSFHATVAQHSGTATYHPQLLIQDVHPTYAPTRQMYCHQQQAVDVRAPEPQSQTGHGGSREHSSHVAHNLGVPRMYPQSPLAFFRMQPQQGTCIPQQQQRLEPSREHPARLAQHFRSDNVATLEERGRLSNLRGSPLSACDANVKDNVRVRSIGDQTLVAEMNQLEISDVPPEAVLPTPRPRSTEHSSSSSRADATGLLLTERAGLPIDLSHGSLNTVKTEPVE